jgi:hypothetical protein
MMDTDTYRKELWAYMSKHHQDARIAWKGYGKVGWKYSTIADYKDTRQEPGNFNHRAVLPEELVLDFDCSDEALPEGVHFVQQKLDQEKHNFTMWRTNSDKGGVHIHSLWNIPATVAEPQLLKNILAEYLTEGKLDEMKIDRQLFGKHLVRFEGGHYEKLPPGKAGRKELLYVNGEPFKKNNIPQAVWDEYTGKVLAFRLRGLRQARKITRARDTPESIKFILSDKFKEHRDGGKRGMFVLASYYRKLPDEELWQLLRDFNRYNLRVPLTDIQMQAIIKSVREHKGAHVGEPYRKNLLRSIGAYKEVYGDD